ncbi:MAG: HPr family phosphocarrier protein [Candidatus Aminicenantia bacterium]
MIEKKIVLKNRLGLHARAASLLVNVAKKFSSSIYLLKNSEEVNAKSILGILTLSASKGSELIVKADGEDEGEALKEIVELIENKFYEDE